MCRATIVTNKLCLLDLIEEKKNILFSSLKITSKEEKEQAWKEVLCKAQSLELLGQEKPWQYVRDALYGLWKSRTLAKKNNYLKTGKYKKFDEIDLKILQICDMPVEPDVAAEIKVEVPYLCFEEKLNEAIDVAEESPKPITNKNIEESPKHIITEDLKESPVYIFAEEFQVEPPMLLEPTLRLQPQKRNMQNSQKYVKNIKRLRLELLELEGYHQRLQILKLEREMKLPPSKYTRNIL